MKHNYEVAGRKWRKPKGSRGKLLRRVRKQRVKYITILPSLITILNGVFGFTAVVLASKAAPPQPGPWSYFALAGYMVLVAMLFDMLDGRLARMSQSTSSFGGQLDSLCDMISFGVAPAFLMLKLVETRMDLANAICEGFLHRFIWLAAIAYIACAAIRLARFNVENEENEMAHMSFVGLPSPGAAGVIVSLVIFHQQEVPHLNYLVYLLPFITLLIAILMVSQIRYPHVLNVYLTGKKPFGHLIWILFLLGLAAEHLPAALLLSFVSFAGGSLVKWLYVKTVGRRGRAALPATELAGGPNPSPATPE
ncbi:MAG: CDP-diacylglycerol--serine O-phosphatidyltransferase [Planctomycetes bacterium]|jgi:CDP-diacylglycerol--serine O-phosphatidyltransferase|nr:CDP-diacylglycerol--serine O-phosphatidyltransferase [Planctomycetota bacterium]